MKIPSNKEERRSICYTLYFADQSYKIAKKLKVIDIYGVWDGIFFCLWANNQQELDFISDILEKEYLLSFYVVFGNPCLLDGLEYDR